MLQSQCTLTAYGTLGIIHITLILLKFCLICTCTCTLMLHINCICALRSEELDIILESAGKIN